MKNLDLLIPRGAPGGGTWAWATIHTGFSPEGDHYISIRLDGEDADLEATPVFLCDPEEFFGTGLTVPEPRRTGRTLVQLLDGQVIVYGESGGIARAAASRLAAGDYAARSGRMLWSAAEPALHVGDGADGWWSFAPTEGGTTAWRNMLTSYYANMGVPRGMTFYDTDLGQLMVWTGSEWAEVGGSSEPVETAKPAGRIVGTGGTPGPIPNGSWTEVTTLADASGSGGRLDNGMTLQGGRLRVPRAGWYQVSGTLTLDSNASNRRGIGLDRASSTGAAFENRWYSLIGAPPSGSATVSHAIPLYCEANDYIRIWAYQNSGVSGGLNINYSASQLQLSAVFLTE